MPKTISIQKMFIVLTVLIFLAGLLVLHAQKKLPGAFVKMQRQENNDLLESKPTNILQNTQSTTTDRSRAQQSGFQSEGILRPPPIVERLCSNPGEQSFVTQDGQQHTFHKSAVSVQRCEAGHIWKAVEEGAKVPDAATFYFDENGILLDICQPLLWRSGCERFESISCEPRNYCEG